MATIYVRETVIETYQLTAGIAIGVLMQTNSNKELIILIGNIGSGKTTIARKYAKKKYVVISMDSLRYMVGSGIYQYGKCEEALWASFYYLFSLLLNAGLSIVIDNSNISKEIRRKLISKGKEYKYKIKGIYLKTSKNKTLCLYRRLTDDRRNTSEEEWEKVWNHFNANLDLPTKQEGFNEIISR